MTGVMELTQVTHTIGQPHSAYCLLAVLSDEAKEQLSELLSLLQDKLGKNVYVMPKESLHITLCEIIQSKEYPEDKELLYLKHASAYKDLSGKVFSQFKPITVILDKIEVSPQAIILKGRDDGSFAGIRKSLVETLPLPAETKMPPTIIHCTIARFLTEIPLEVVRGIVGESTLSLNEEVHSFSLVHSTVSPLLSYETIQRYELH